jgi:hypothetical protein
LSEGLAEADIHLATLRAVDAQLREAVEDIGTALLVDEQDEAEGEYGVDPLLHDLQGLEYLLGPPDLA